MVILAEAHSMAVLVIAAALLAVQVFLYSFADVFQV